MFQYDFFLLQLTLYFLHIAVDFLLQTLANAPPLSGEESVQTLIAFPTFQFGQEAGLIKYKSWKLMIIIYKLGSLEE